MKTLTLTAKTFNKKFYSEVYKNVEGAKYFRQDEATKTSYISNDSCELAKAVSVDNVITLYVY